MDYLMRRSRIIFSGDLFYTELTYHKVYSSASWFELVTG